jgi:hypothetical protein
MAKKFLVPINVVRLASNPENGTEGDIYFNTSSQELRIFSEGIWKSISYDISASIASLDYVDTQVDDIYDFIFDGLTTDDIYEGEYNLFLTPENVEAVAGSVISSASANALNEAIIYTDNELSNLNIFSTIVTNPETQTIVGDSNSDALTFIAGENISITAASASDSITINSTGDYTSVTSISTPDFIEFNTAYVPDDPMPTGSLYWNLEDQALEVALENGVTLNLGQEENYPPVFNNSGVQINRGELVMVTGVQGDKLTIAKAVSDGTIDFNYIIGIAAHDIPNTSDTATIIKFGYVNPVNTNSYDVGTILYPDRSVPGGLTNILPDAPGYKIPIAIVTKKGTGGRILVRMSLPSRLGESDSNVQFNNLQNENILVYNSASSLWVNSNELTNLKSRVSTIEDNNNYSNAVVVNTNSPTVCDQWNVGDITTLDYVIQIKQGSKYQSQKMLAVTDGSIINYNNHAIISIGDPISNLSVTASISNGIGRLWVQISDAQINNAEVKILRTKIS